ncbi:MAG: arginine--tRNA ligase [Oscillospiraceae bacterium]|nr:arginine--tRNA ligase [Oscillospiraceae bacterium]
MNIKEALTQIVSSAFSQCGYEARLGGVAESARPDLCQYQCNGALAAAKQAKKKPIIIAEEITSCLENDDRFSKIETAPPGFINITLSDKYLAGLLNTMSGDSRLGIRKAEVKTVVVDYGGPNVAKPLHVGHLRSAIIGQSLCNLARFLGYNVISDVHLGDWGLQMGLVISEVELRQPNLPYFNAEYNGEYPKEPPITEEELSEIYPAAASRAKTYSEFAARASRATVELQDGLPGYRKLWEHIREISISSLKRDYSRLGVSFDKWLGESDAGKYVPKVLGLLDEKGLLADSDGAKVVEVALAEDREPMPPMIVVKSDGGDNYAITDLASLLQRRSDWNPDECWYIVDNRQTLHFKQVFRAACLAGLFTQSQCTHYGFGTMNGKDGKPYKTRDGGVMRLSELIASVTASARAKVELSSVEMSEQEMADAARQIGVAALKVGDMINHRSKDYIFDIERFLATDGRTGPYLQYTTVRIRSVLKKAEASGFIPGEILAPQSQTERALGLALLTLPDTLSRALNEKAPNIICEAMFSIAGELNRFYFENKIISCPDSSIRSSWLGLLDLTRKALELLLGIIGIEVPRSM